MALLSVRSVPRAEVAKSVYVNQRGAGQAKFSVPLQHSQHSIDAGIQPERVAAVGHSGPAFVIPHGVVLLIGVIRLAVFLPPQPRAPGVCWLSEYRSERRQQGGADGGSGASERNTGKPTTHDRGWFYGAVIADPDGNRVRLVGCDLLKAACRSLYRVV
ncbi:hypothetical protein [Pectobacterium parmentieri]|uniref:hypothetical protein n=1 Tax=Pectobacterium parmentieri TaxID=1905730 RepID=UPI000473EBF0|nr:hypothetical protein [Pectobacterium parmentieri]PWD67092.1 hypothetical protein DF211_05000 [Pectobacterium parmentieri]